jgi:hypothetical protein
VAIHKKNFTFALNKTDELLLPNEPDPRRKLNEVLGDLLYRLKESAGVDGPVIFCISARCEFSGVYDPILSAEFAKLRDYLAAKWDEKEIAAVKRANVEEQTVRLIEELREHIDPEPKEELVRKLSALYAHTPEASSLDRLTMNDLEERLASALFSQLWIEDTSISPVKTAMRLQHRLKYAFSHPAESPAELLKSAGELLTAKSAANLRQDTLVGRTEALLVVGAHRGLTASPDTGGVVRKAVEDAAERFARETETKSRFFGLARFRRGMQRLALLVPVLLFLARLAGSSADQFLADPGFGAAVYAIGRLLTSFFGGEGLSGLIALLTIEILLIMFLASRRLKKIERASHALALRALEMMQESASRTVRAVYEEKRDESRRMQSGLDELRHLTVALKQ